jgi:acetolactate synthase-1/2/3 large subunit
MQGQDWLADADVIVAMDSAVPWVPRRFRPRSDATVIHLGADPAYTMYPYRDFPASRLIAGATTSGLRMLKDALASQSFDDQKVASRRRQVAGLLADAASRRADRIADGASRSPISAAWTAECINRVKSDRAVLVNELGVPFDCLEFAGDEVFIGETTAGGLGSGIGFGLGARLAAPDRDVICCVGDGSFMFGNPTPAFLVADALGLPVTVVVANNGMWYAVEQTTLDIYPDGQAAGAGNHTLPLTQFRSSPDYAALAAACGAHGETVRDPADLEGALRRALEQNAGGRAALVDVVTEPGTR